MKLIKTLACSALLLAAFAGVASAQTVIRINGSTAFRKNVQNGIGHLLAPGFTYAYYTDPSTGFSDITKAQASIYKGTLANTTPVSWGANLGASVVIKCYWNGSISGPTNLVAGTVPTPPAGFSTPWLSESNPTSTAGTALNSPVFNDASSAPDVAYSDVDPGTAQIHGFKSATFANQVVGIVPFTLSKGLGWPTAVTNMTSRQYVAIETAPQAFSLLNGGADAASVNTYVFAVGRDKDSGTRFMALDETGFGPFNPTQHYLPTFDTSAVVSKLSIGSAGTGYPVSSTQPLTITTLSGFTGSGAAGTATIDATGKVSAVTLTNGGSGYNKAPQVTVGGGGSGATVNAQISGGGITDANIWPAGLGFGADIDGDGGYVNGPDVANALNATPPAYPTQLPSLGVSAVFVGHVSVGDAGSIGPVTNGNILTFNGAAYNFANVTNGTYSFWNYEHEVYAKSLTGVKGAYALNLGNQVFSIEVTASTSPTGLPGALATGQMNCARSTEAAVITYGSPNFTTYPNSP